MEPDTIFVVSISGPTVYRYDGFGREVFDALTGADSVGQAWGTLLREPLKQQGRQAEKIQIDDYERLLGPETPLVYQYDCAPSAYAW